MIFHIPRCRPMSGPMRILCLIPALLAAAPAFALSCLPPDPVALYERARDAEERYVIVRGEVRPEGPVAVPQDGKEVETPARIEGVSLTSEGFTAPFDREVTLRLGCMGPWCANAPDDGETISMVQLEGTRLVLELDACFSTSVPASDDGARAVVECHRGGDCVTAF